jgi:hypothetical protein
LQTKTIIMEKNIELNEVMILKGGDEIIITGMKVQNHFTYQVSWYVENTQLNKILNFLQGENYEIDVFGAFKSSVDENGTNVLYLDTRNLTRKEVPYQMILAETKHFAIRA